MAEELLLNPEISMHEEPGQINFHGSGEVSVEIDDEEPEPTNGGHGGRNTTASGYEIPADISITRVPKGSQLQQQQKMGGGFLKVRSDLTKPPPGPTVRSGPPPLIRAGGPRPPGLPPLPRLRFGGHNRPMVRHPGMFQQPQRMPMRPQGHPLVGMYNMGHHQVPHGGHGGQRLPPPPLNVVRHQQPQQHQFNGRGPAVMPPRMMRQQRLPSHKRPSSNQLPPHVLAQMHANLERARNSSASGASSPVLKNTQLPSNIKVGGRPKTMPMPIRSGPFVRPPPPMRSKAASTNSGSTARLLANGGFPELNITVTSVPKKQQQQQQQHQRQPLPQDFAEEEIDDDEEEALDDVEPDEDQNQAPPRGHHRGPKVMGPRPTQQSLLKKRRMQLQMQFVRRPDGKGFMRKPASSATSNGSGNSVAILKAAEAAVAKAKKKKRRMFRGANYRFDGSSIKKKKGANHHKSSSAAGSSSTSVNNDELTITLKEVPKPEAGNREFKKEGDFLSYLGIQRKDSSSDETPPGSGSGLASLPKPASQKAKKSFRPSSTSPPVTNASGESLTNRKRVHESSKEFLASGGKKSRSDDNLANHSSDLLKLENLESLSGEEKPLSRTRPKEARNQMYNETSTKLQPCVCFCAKEDVDLVEDTKAKSKASYKCEAIETVGGSTVGCLNKVQNFRRRKVAEKAAGGLYCDAHIQRIKSHMCCGFCGNFCAHGAFYMCRPFKEADPHLFCKRCYDNSPQKKCPHCEITEKPLQVLLKLSMARIPLHLLQTTSKMTFGKSKKPTASDLILSRKDIVSYKLPNGQIISTEGLPDGLTDESLAKVIAAVEDRDKLKHTTRNMHLPTKSGDNVKLLQLLSLGYSPQQKFSEASGGSPLHVAAREGHVLTAHILVQAGAELDAIDNNQETPLMVACTKGKSMIVKYLLAAGADLTLRDNEGMTCLHLAAQNGRLECVHIILGQNNLPRKFINRQDEGGWTPLVWACENKHEDVINYLLARGADPLITDAEGNVALHWAALSGSWRTCETLLNYGCDVNATNLIGETPMHIILRQDHYDCAVLFLMRKARLDIKNKNGQVPVECIVTKTPECGTIVKLTTTLYDMMKDTAFNRLERIVVNDITHGKESNPIQCVNDLDEATEPTEYVYVKNCCQTTPLPVDRNIATLQHCRCQDNCTTEDTCNCSDLSVKSWYDLEGKLKEGFDYREPPMIFECNDLCRCNVNSCHNRVLQHGMSARLQVYRAYGMGWGVRPLHDIAKGSFVCEYVGEIISDSEAETREDSYLFDLENKDGETFCIDANHFGNIARFINHSCSPNLTPVKVFSNHQDLRFPHIALFANRDIKKGEDLGFDYGEKFWVIKHKFFTCHCNSEKCRYNKTNMTSFLREYYKRNGEPLPPELQPLPPPIAPKEPEDEVIKEQPTAAASEAKSDNPEKENTAEAAPKENKGPNTIVYSEAINIKTEPPQTPEPQAFSTLISDMVEDEIAASAGLTSASDPDPTADSIENNPETTTKDNDNENAEDSDVMKKEPVTPTATTPAASGTSATPATPSATESPLTSASKRPRRAVTLKQTDEKTSSEKH